MDFFEDLARHGDRPAVIDDRGGSYTYRQLRDLVADFRNALPTGRRALVLVRTGNRIESLVGYLGAVAGGHVVLAVDHALDPALSQRLAEFYRPDYVWGGRTGAGAPLFELDGYRLTPLDGAAGAGLHDDLSAVLLTSGSTGSPKGVRLSRRNLLANARSIALYLGLDATDRAVTSLPMSYSYGLSVINSHLYAGATVLLTEESVLRRRFWDFCREHGATSFAGVPLTYELLDTVGFPGLELPSLRHFTQAGGRMAPAHVARYAEEARRRSARFYVMYGQTEATARIAYLCTDEYPGKTDTVGGAVPDGRLYLKDASGSLVTAIGTVGRLWYQGPNVMLGYASGRDDLSRGDELYGELDTGDDAFLDADGHCHIVGRSNRFIKMSGIRIDLDQVEEHLVVQGMSCACAGQDDLLTVAVTGTVAASTVKRALRTAFRIDPSRVSVVEAPVIPRTPSGKIAYAQLFGNG